MTFPNWNTGLQDQAAPVLTEWANNYGLPLDVVFGQAALESAFNPNATGAAGEIGLFQIKLSTAQGLGFSGSGQDLYDPDANAQFGLLYLRNMLDKYGDIGLALSAYNAGRPITGNAAYVQGVQDRAAYFDALWGSSPGSLPNGVAGTSTTATIVVLGAFLALAYYFAKSFGFIK